MKQIAAAQRNRTVRVTLITNGDVTLLRREDMEYEEMSLRNRVTSPFVIGDDMDDCSPPEKRGKSYDTWRLVYILSQKPGAKMEIPVIACS